MYVKVKKYIIIGNVEVNVITYNNYAIGNDIVDDVSKGLTICGLINKVWLSMLI